MDSHEILEQSFGSLAECTPGLTVFILSDMKRWLFSFIYVIAHIAGVLQLSPWHVLSTTGCGI